MFNSVGILILFLLQYYDDVDVDGYMGSVDNSVIDTDEEQDCSTPVQGPATKTEQESTNRSYSGVLRSREAQAPASSLISSKSGSRDGGGPSKPKEGVQGSYERGRKEDERGSQSKNISRKEHILDLHGKSCHEARLDVKQKFRTLSNSPSEENVEVITGRGLHSVEGKAVIQKNIEELLRTLHVKVKKINKGGAFIVTIPALTELNLSDDERRDKQVLFPDVCQAQLFKMNPPNSAIIGSGSSKKLKGASSSNAQALVSHSGEYIEEGMDDDVGKIKAFAQLIRCWERGVLSMPIEIDIFGEKNEKYHVFKQDLIDFCEMKTVDVTLISTYMRYLYAKYEKSCKKIKFVNPASISTTDYIRELSRISKRLERRKNSQLCFIPYNIQSKFHWVLMVIDCSSMLVYWVDSLHGEPDELTKNLVMKGLAPLCGGDKPRPTWSIIKGPKQTDCVQCGYYVMKFMRELMYDHSKSIEVKMERLIGRDVYTPEEINGVRAELINYVEEK